MGSGKGRARAVDQGHGQAVRVYRVMEDVACGRCGKRIRKGGLARQRRGVPVCLLCSHLAHLVFLPAGDGALTLHAGRLSAVKAVVVGRTGPKQRHRRQGLLVERQALKRAAEKREADSQALAERQRRAAVRRAVRGEVEPDPLAVVERRIRQLFPGCPPDERRLIAERVCNGSKGQWSGASEAKEAESREVRRAVRAYVRRRHTGYDELLRKGMGSEKAKAAVSAEVYRRLREWKR